MDFDKIIDKILDELGISYTDTISDRNTLLISDIIYCLIATRTIKETAELLGIGESALEHLLHRYLKYKVNKLSREKWDYWLLNLINLRRCPICLEILELDKFSSSTICISRCLECDNKKSKEYRLKDPESARLRNISHYNRNKKAYFYKNSIRRAKKCMATVPWADLAKIKKIYLNCPEGMHVDHIIPLQGEQVSGLHVEYNLQYLTAEKNLKKSNKFTPS